MRGGALPILAWAGLLALLGAGNWVWTGDTIEVAEFGFAVLLILLSGVALVAAHRGAIRRGPPPAAARPRLLTLPELSLGSALAPFAIASILFGLAFGHFLIYFGAALFVLALGRVSVELRAERRTRRRLEALSLADPTTPEERR